MPFRGFQTSPPPPSSPHPAASIFAIKHVAPAGAIASAAPPSLAQAPAASSRGAPPHLSAAGSAKAAAAKATVPSAAVAVPQRSAPPSSSAYSSFGGSGLLSSERVVVGRTASEQMVRAAIDFYGRAAPQVDGFYKQPLTAWGYDKAKAAWELLLRDIGSSKVCAAHVNALVAHNVNHPVIKDLQEMMAKIVNIDEAFAGSASRRP